MELSEYKSDGFLHFIGCGGAGTRPLMKIFHELGFRVSGSDMAESESLERLRGIGIPVFAGHDARHLPTSDGAKLLLIYSSAVTEANPELAEARRIGAWCIRRGEALGLLTRMFPYVIAVSGSHGKTSVSAMIAHILKEAGLEPGYLIGADIVSWSDSGSAGAGRIFVCEADESDGTHTAIRSSVAVVTNVEDDHSWNFASPEVLMENFRKFAFQGEKLIYADGRNSFRLFHDHPDAVKIPQGALLDDPRFASFGYYRRINAVTALEAVTCNGVLDRETALEALSSFPGVERRMCLRAAGEKHLLVEDYAHHPTELAASLKTMRELYPGRRLVVVFQPHRYARLKQYFHEFASELSEADEVFITPVFAAWTQSGTPGSSDLARAVGSHAHFLEGSWEDMAGQVFQALKENDLAAVIGAGDIKEMIGPLRRQIIRISDLGLVIAAGGSSTRFGRGNKLFCKLNGMPVFVHCLRRLLPLVRSGYAVMSVPEELKDEFAGQLSEYFPEALPHIRLAVGGKTRTESVRNALAALPVDVGVVAVHDAARPLVSADALIECVRECRKYGGAVSARRSSDTVKETDEHGFVVRTVPREGLWTVQTPQVFQLKLLRSAYEEAEKQGGLFTDDASLVENFTPAKVKLVENRAPNIKITYPEDLLFAEACLKE